MCRAAWGTHLWKFGPRTPCRSRLRPPHFQALVKGYGFSSAVAEDVTSATIPQTRQLDRTSKRVYTRNNKSEVQYIRQLKGGLRERTKGGVIYDIVVNTPETRDLVHTKLIVERPEMSACDRFIHQDASRHCCSLCRTLTLTSGYMLAS